MCLLASSELPKLLLSNQKGLVLSNGEHWNWRNVQLHNEMMDMIQCTDYKSVQ